MIIHNRITGKTNFVQYIVTDIYLRHKTIIKGGLNLASAMHDIKQNYPYLNVVINIFDSKS
ncbi:MAG: hypothetical protein GWP19_08105 [Planctomycetia bacterium]|nr:hypothetical protein [Planctomycetia bacterium]